MSFGRLQFVVFILGVILGFLFCSDCDTGWYAKTKPVVRLELEK